ncbi:MAG: patatin-like phospholipase family protein [Defluviitaleaceae bacterium]|nr:patatin-like phospholipase family protein [Defluviitaleaceae bacterium]
MTQLKVRVLAIDGGGIRGVIPAQLLVYIERMLQEISRNEKAKISDYFDLIAGTSTGGILTALILAPEPGYTASDMVQLYVAHGADIFSRSWMTKKLDRGGLFHPLYQHEPLEALLKTYLGDLKISELVRPCLIPTYNIETGVAVFTSSLEILKNPNSDCLVRDVLRATTAAPTYFAPTFQNPDAFIDGGMFANNPALCAYIEATKFPSEPRPCEMMVLSLGTGSINRYYPYEVAKRWGRLNWLRPALEIYASAASQTVDHQMKIIYRNKDRIDNYLRIEPHLKDFPASLAMDDATTQNIKALIDVGDHMYQSFDVQLKAFLQKVVFSHVTSGHERLYETSNKG